MFRNCHQIRCSYEELRICWTNLVLPELQAQLSTERWGVEGRGGMGTGCHTHPNCPFPSTLCHPVSSSQPHEEGIIPTFTNGETEAEEMKCQAQSCLTSVSPRIQSQNGPRAQSLKVSPAVLSFTGKLGTNRCHTHSGRIPSAPILEVWHC